MTQTVSLTEQLGIVEIISINAVRTLKEFNPREELDRAEIETLMVSIRSRGLLEPILLRRSDNELIDGLHRWTACKKLGHERIAARFIEATDLDAKVHALVANSFGKRLNELEVGRNAAAIIDFIPKRTGRLEKEKELAKGLGIDVVLLREYVATHRLLIPEARSMAAKLIKQGKLRVKWLHDIRRLDPERGQMAALNLVDRASDVQAADRQLSAFLASHEVEERKKKEKQAQSQKKETPPTKSKSASSTSQEKEDVPHYMKQYEVKVRAAKIESLRGGAVWFDAGDGKLMNLKEMLTDRVFKHAKINDLVNAHVFLELLIQKKTK